MVKIIHTENWKVPDQKKDIGPLMDWKATRLSEICGDAQYDDNYEIVDVESKIKLAELNGLVAAELLRCGYTPEEVEEKSRYW